MEKDLERGSSGRREMVEKKILIIMIWVKEMGWEGGVCLNDDEVEVEVDYYYCKTIGSQEPKSTSSRWRSEAERS